MTSAASYAEVLRGVRIPAEATASMRLVERIPVSPFDEGTARAELPFRTGRVARLIAAPAMSLDLTPFTNNVRDFAETSGLRLGDWTA